jgi:hypothetical protein
MFNHRTAVAALASLALAGTVAAVPASAAQNVPVTKTTIEITYGNKPGKGCPYNGKTVPDGTTVATTDTFATGDSVTSYQECRNGGWFAAQTLGGGTTGTTGTSGPTPPPNAPSGGGVSGAPGPTPPPNAP